jgi:hypothetical protein
VLGVVGGSALTIGRTNGVGDAIINLDDSGATYNFKANTRTIMITAQDCTVASGASAANTGDFESWSFTAAGTTSIRCTFAVPTDWSSASNMTTQLEYIGKSTVVGNFNSRWQIEYTPRGFQEDITAGSTTVATTSCMAYNGIPDGCSMPATYTANNRLSTDAVTILGTNLAAGDIVSLEISRLGDDAADSYTGVTELLMIRMNYTSTTPRNG